MTEPTDVNLSDLRRRARRRLVGAIVLALAAAVFVPMLLESDPKPLGEDVAVRIPPVDDGKFVNRLNEKNKVTPVRPAPAEAIRTDGAKHEPPKSDPAKADAAKGEAGKPESGKGDAGKGDGAKSDSAKSDAAKSDAAKSDAAKSDAAKSDAMPSEAPQQDAAKAAAATSDSAPKRSLAEAEQKVLSAPAKVAAAPAPRTVESVAATAPAAPVVAADAAGGFAVQLAAFSDDKGANSLSNKLKKAGYPAYTEPLTTSRGTLWRVRVGPYPSRETAGTTRDKLKGEGYSGIVAPSK